MQSHSPQPPRRRRRGILWRAAVVLVLLMLALRLAWGWWVDRRVQAQLDDLRRRGLPVYVSDIAVEPVPDAENAWLVISEAAACLVPGVDSPRNSTGTFEDYPPFPPEWTQLAEASERAHGRAFALARQARRFPRADLQRRLSSPLAVALNASWRMLGKSNQLDMALSDGALYAHVIAGDDAEALERCMDVLHIARIVRSGGLMLDQSHSYNSEAWSCVRLRVIGAGLRFDASAAKRPATREQVRQIIGHLLDEEDLRTDLRRAVMCERVAELDAKRDAAGGSWFLRPLVGTELLRLNPYIDAALVAIDCTNRPAVSEVFSIALSHTGLHDTAIRWLGEERESIPRYARWYTDPIHIEPSFEQYYRIISERRTTAVALACHLYRADHGQWPDRLDALAPAYLPAVPADPYHADGRPIGYAILKGRLPDGGDRPVLWFDAGPVDASIPAEPTYGWYTDGAAMRTYKECRQYRDLLRFTPPPKSPEAVEDDPGEADAPRDQAQQNDQAEEP